MRPISPTKLVAYLLILIVVFPIIILTVWLSDRLQWHDVISEGIVGVLAAVLFALLVAFVVYIIAIVRSGVKVVDCDKIDFSNLLSKAAGGLDISGITLENALSELSGPGFGEDRLAHFEQKKDLQIRLLFCDPRSSYLIDRAHWEEGDDLDRLKYDVWVSIAKACLIAQRFDELSCKDKVKIKTKLLNAYNLTCSTFRNADLLISGPYLAIGQGKYTMRVQVWRHRNRHLFKQLLDDFDLLWEKAEWLTQSAQRSGMSINFGLLEKLGLSEKNNFDFSAISYAKKIARLSPHPMHPAIFQKAQEILQAYWSKSTKGDIE